MQELSAEEYFSLEQYTHRSLFQGITYVWEPLITLTAYLEKQKLGKIEIDVPKSVYLVNPELISIGAGTVIEPGTYIHGPAIIGPKNTIRHGAYIRGNVITGEGCVIGHTTEVKHSIFLSRANAAHFNYVGDSILGNDVNIGAGVKLANFKLDHKDVNLFYRGQKILTKLRKFGAILGDGVQIGCNAVTNPGTLIGKEAFCYPCTNIQGVLLPKSIYKGSKR